MQLIITIDRPGAMARLGGITVWQRLVRTLSKLNIGPIRLLVSKDFDTAPFPIRRRDGNVEIEWLDPESPTLTTEGILRHLKDSQKAALIVPGDLVIDPRLLTALVNGEPNSALFDSALPHSQAKLLGSAPTTLGGYVCGPAVLDRNWLENHPGSFWPQVPAALSSGELSSSDVALLPTYAPELRKPLRPYWFRIDHPSRLSRSVESIAKKLLLDATHKGSLDLPALFHAPIEKFASWRLADTPITPNQITVLTTILAWIATWQFAAGSLQIGIGVALAVGVLDGIDGKLARLRLETSKFGELEHWLDFLYEWSWWIALAYRFSTSETLPNAWNLLGVLIVAEVIDGVMKLSIIRNFGKMIDEMGRFDRAVRLVGGRRNVYVWILAVGIFRGQAEQAFSFLPWIEGGTALIHSFRAPWLIWKQRSSSSVGESENSTLEMSK